MNPDVLSGLACLAFVLVPVLFVVLEPYLNAARAVLTGSKEDLVYDGNLCDEPIPYGDRTYADERKKAEAEAARARLDASCARYEEWLRRPKS
jgi:hypothetical protein